MISLQLVIEVIGDGFFAAIAAIGFAIISNPPRKALFISAFLAAVGHGLRYFLMHAPYIEWNIISSSFFAALSIGLLALPFAKAIRCPAEVFSFPSLLPMIPGMFAYKAVQALAKFIVCTGYEESMIYIETFFRNGITTLFVLFALVVGVSISIFLFPKLAFSSTR